MTDDWVKRLQQSAARPEPTLDDIAARAISCDIHQVEAGKGNKPPHHLLTIRFQYAPLEEDDIIDGLMEDLRELLDKKKLPPTSERTKATDKLGHYCERSLHYRESPEIIKELAAFADELNASIDAKQRDIMP